MFDAQNLQMRVVYNNHEVRATSGDRLSSSNCTQFAVDNYSLRQMLQKNVQQHRCVDII